MSKSRGVFAVVRALEYCVQSGLAQTTLKKACLVGAVPHSQINYMSWPITRVPIHLHDLPISCYKRQADGSSARTQIQETHVFYVKAKTKCNTAAEVAGMTIG